MTGQRVFAAPGIIRAPGPAASLRNVSIQHQALSTAFVTKRFAVHWSEWCRCEFKDLLAVLRNR
jgi:hypothetical protein